MASERIELSSCFPYLNTAMSLHRSVLKATQLSWMSDAMSPALNLRPVSMVQHGGVLLSP